MQQKTDDPAPSEHNAPPLPRFSILPIVEAHGSAFRPVVARSPRCASSHASGNRECRHALRRHAMPSYSPSSADCLDRVNTRVSSKTAILADAYPIRVASMPILGHHFQQWAPCVLSGSYPTCGFLLCRSAATCPLRPLGFFGTH